MNWSATAAALLVAAAPAVAAAQQNHAENHRTASPQSITLQGCVKAGVDKDTVLMTNVVESSAAGRAAVPTDAHGRKVIFWLDKDEMLKPHVGHMVQVTGQTTGIEESEIEFKTGRQADGGLAVEFEGPGKDVKASTGQLAGSLGTSGTTGSTGAAKAEKNDIKTFLFKVKVENVQATAGACN